MYARNARGHAMLMHACLRLCVLAQSLVCQAMLVPLLPRACAGVVFFVD